jgi:mono/diheme cytochrome c family protein
MWSRGAVVVAVALAAGCASDWRTDMWYQPSVRAQAAPRPEPAGSVPLGVPALPRSRDEAATVENPIAPDPASLARGRAVFAERCAPCHGLDGHGRGPVARLFPQPADLVYEKVRARSDGFIWGTVTFGGDAMPPAAEGLDARTRWDLVNHVRALQRGGAR